jgi:hypothetical protein
MEELIEMIEIYEDCATNMIFNTINYYIDMINLLCEITPDKTY